MKVKRVRFETTLDPKTKKTLKILAAKEEKDQNQLLEEMIQERAELHGE